MSGKRLFGPQHPLRGDCSELFGGTNQVMTFEETLMGSTFYPPEIARIAWVGIREDWTCIY